MSRADVVQYVTGCLLQTLPSDFGAGIVDLYRRLKAVC
jgi:hypothetical protein